MRGRDLVAHGTGWVERIVVDDADTSTYFTPLSITLNIDSFEHLEFETRPDQLLVYTLVQGDERVIIEFAPVGPGDGDEASPFGAAPARVRHQRLVQMELLGLDAGDATTTPSRPAAQAPALDRGRTADPERRRAHAERAGAQPASRDADDHHEITSRYGSISRKNVAERPAVNGFVDAEDRVDALDVEDEPARSPRTGRRRTPRGAGSHWAKITSPTAIQPRPLDRLVAEPAGRDRQRDRRPGQAGQHAADERRRRSAAGRR